MNDQPDKIIAPPPSRRGSHDAPMTLNDAGKWVYAIPEPGTRLLQVQCPGLPNKPCRRSFWTKDGYRGHYALAHILGTP